MEPLKLFISYTHQDERYKDQLISHLSSLKRREIIKEWHDRKLTGGQEFDGVIKQELLDADIILLLISANFIDSNYCFDVEIKKAMERHELGEATVIPVIIRPCDWHDLPFSKIQGLPKDAKPLSTWIDLDEGYLNIINSIKSVIEKKNAAESDKVKIDSSNFVENCSHDVVIHRLPRGYIVIEDIEFNENPSWNVVASYYDYNGNCRHGTHYHESYRKRWESPQGQDNQCAKLRIQKGDWNLANTALFLITELRGRGESDSIEKIIGDYQGDDEYFEYYKKGESIPKPVIPDNFIYLSRTGEIRDIIEELRIDSWKNYDLKTLHTEFESYRRSAYLILYDKLPIQHPALSFVKEIIDAYDETFDIKKLRNWGDRLSDALYDCCTYIK